MPRKSDHGIRGGNNKCLIEKRNLFNNFRKRSSEIENKSSLATLMQIIAFSRIFLLVKKGSNFIDFIGLPDLESEFKNISAIKNE